jgi:hypothetical protein
MKDDKYEEAIIKLKEAYPEFKDVNFQIENGELSYQLGIWSVVEKIDMGELQKFVNTFLGQKVYRAEYIGYFDVYARSEDEAKEFTNHIKPRVITRYKISQTELEKINFI